MQYKWKNESSEVILRDRVRSSVNQEGLRTESGGIPGGCTRADRVERMVYPLLDSDMLERLCLRIGWLYFEFGYFILGSE